MRGRWTFLVLPMMLTACSQEAAELRPPWTPLWANVLIPPPANAPEIVEHLTYDLAGIGIMKSQPKGDRSLKSDDRAALRAICETHIKGQGW